MTLCAGTPASLSRTRHLDVLLGEHVAFGDCEKRGRQAVERGEQRADQRVLCVRVGAHVVAPVLAHLLAAEHVFRAAVAPAGIRGTLRDESPVIEQHGLQRRHGILLTAQEAGRHAQVGAGRVAADCEPPGIDPEREALLRQPAQDVDRLLERHRKFLLWRERVVDANHATGGARGVFAHDAVVGIDAEQRPAAAMQVDEAGQDAAGGAVNARAHRAVPRRHGVFPRLEHRRARPAARARALPPPSGVVADTERCPNRDAAFRLRQSCG